MIGEEIARRAYAVWDGLNTVVYSMTTTKSPTRHRDDCSGFVSACLGLPTPGLSTVNLVRSKAFPDAPLYEVPIQDIESGDIIGICGPGTAGAAGHVRVFVRFDAQGRYVVVEQAIGRTGPDESVYTHEDLMNDGYKVYRLSSLEDEEVSRVVAVTAGELAGKSFVVSGVWRVYLSSLEDLAAALEYHKQDVAELVGDISWTVDARAQSGGSVTDHVHTLTTGGVI